MGDAKILCAYSWALAAVYRTSGSRSVASTVEHLNAHIKNPSHEDIANSGRRGGRGYAYQYLMATLAVVAGNIRKIITFPNRPEGPRKSTSPFRSEKSARAQRQEAKKHARFIKKPQDGRATRFPSRT